MYEHSGFITVTTITTLGAPPIPPQPHQSMGAHFPEIAT
jgi:hypothetical protein